MNRAARTFRRLEQLWHLDAASPEVDILAAELASTVAEGPWCVAVRPKGNVSSLYGLVFLLDTYGLILSQRCREDDTVLVSVEAAPDRVSEFEGFAVTEVRLETEAAA